MVEVVVAGGEPEGHLVPERVALGADHRVRLVVQPSLLHDVARGIVAVEVEVHVLVHVPAARSWQRSQVVPKSSQVVS